MIEIRQDVYGQYARFTAVADVLEAAALKGRKVRHSRLVDWLGDAELTLSNDLYRPESLPDPDSDEDGYREAANVVFDLLRERSEYLGKRYPFVVSKDSLESRLASDRTYVEVLALTLAHAYGIATTDKPTAVFEEVVNRLFLDRGWRSTQVGKHRGKFSSSLKAAGTDVSIKLSADSAVHSRAANDDKVDVLAHFWLDDHRPGRVVAIGQATLERSSGWEKKASEPSGGTWRRYMNDHVKPLTFLAVPHHMEPRTFQRIAEREAVPIDRLRIVPSIRTMPPAASAIASAVLAEDVEFR